MTESELPGIIKKIEKRLQARRYRAAVAKVWAATYVLMGLRYSADLAGLLLRGVVSMKESTTYQAILREGWEGGALAEAKKALLIVGERRLGAPDRHTRSLLESIQEVERVEELMTRLHDAASWRELLEHPVHRPRAAPLRLGPDEDLRGR